MKKSKKDKNKNNHQIKTQVIPPAKIAEPTSPTISVCMIVQNEENNLPKCLASIKDFADEIIVVDTGSTDRTVDIAKECGAKIYHFAWCNDFSAARNESLKYATKDFIMWLDARDEFKNEEYTKLKEDLSVIKKCIVLRNECNRMRNILKTAKIEGVDDVVKYAFRLALLDKDSNIYAEQLRVFENNAGFYFVNKVQEELANDIAVRAISSSAVILHHGF